MRSNRAWIVSELIAKENRQFKIPVYQRSYDWRPSQCKRLYSDIIYSINAGLDNHFTGTVVYLNSKYSSSHTEEIIIDGQQRITTILILLKALYDKAVTSDDVELVRSVSTYIKNSNKEVSSKLIPVKNDFDDYNDLMSNNIDQISHGSNFYLNYMVFSKLIDESQKNGLSLRQILEGVKKLLIVEIVLNESDGDNPQAIFESINSTGLDLTLSDQIRNFILMADKEQDRLFEEYWVPIQETIGKDFLSDFFVTYLNMTTTENIKLENTYEKFKKYYYDNKLNSEDLLTKLRHYSQLYKVLISSSENYSHEINKHTDDLRILNQTTIYPFLLRVLDDHSNNRLVTSELDKVLRFFVVYSLRRIIVGVPSNTLRSLYKTLYKRIFTDDSKYNNYYDSITEFFVKIKNRDALPSEEEFKQQLLIDKLYQKRNVCKYVLSTIENQNSNEKVDVSDLTIEHVMPQSLPPHWRKYLGLDAELIRDKYLHTIGNLTITGYNSELSVKSFEEKKEMIQERSKMVILNQDITTSITWNEVTIKNRAERLVSLALERFMIDVKTVEGESVLSDTQATLIDYEKFHKAQATGYIFNEIYKPVSDFNDLLKNIIEDLYELDSDLLHQVAENELRLFNTDTVVISKNDSVLKDYIEVKDSGIYVLKSVTPRYKMQIATRLLDMYDIHYSEIIIDLTPREKGKNKDQVFSAIIASINLDEDVVESFFEDMKKIYSVRTLSASINIYFGSSKLGLISFWNDGTASLKMNILDRFVKEKGLDDNIYGELLVIMEDYLVETPKLIQRRNKYAGIDPIQLIIGLNEFKLKMNGFISKWKL